MKQLKIFMKFLKMIFLEIQKSKNENLELYKYIIKKSNDLKIPLVATNENFFK